MDKIRTVLFILLIFISCKHEVKKGDILSNLEIEFNDFITYDFKTANLKVEVDSFKYIDTLNISEEDLFRIYGSFEASKISEMKGEKFYTDTNMTFPADFLVLKFYNRDRIKCKINISKKMKLIKSNEVNKIVEFKNLLLEIFQKDEKFKKALEISFEKQRKTNNILF